MSIQNNFQKFYNNILLTSKQREDAKRKYHGVCKKLHDHYYTDVKYTGQTKLLIGSYGKHTHVRPARDVDVIFIMPFDKFGQYDDNQSNCQSQLLQDIKKLLEEKYPDTPIKAFGKVVVLEFTDTQHNIELLPAWEKEDKSFIIPNSENGGSWENWNPRLEIKKIQDQDAKTKKTKEFIRMAKKWVENCSVDIKSYQIENLVLNFFNYYEIKNQSNSLLMRDFFMFSYNSGNRTNTNSHLKTALKRAKKAYAFENNNKPGEAVNEWGKIFGSDFPVTVLEEKESISQGKLILLQNKYPSSQEQHLSDFDIDIKINPNYTIKIDAFIKQDGFRENWLSEFIRKNMQLKKYKSILFKIKKINVSRPYDIKWKVRNFGEEASIAGDLRGEISDDLGYSEKQEKTKYEGEHYVECYIIQDNQCVAMDHVLVPIE